MEKIKEQFAAFVDLVKERVGEVEENVEERLALHIEDFLTATIQNIEECESPIEKMIALEFNRIINRSFLDAGYNVFDWEPQREIILNEDTQSEKKYRVDFFFHFAQMKERGAIEYSFAIECDGHEFHEKTKEQAAKDKQKDRDLMKNGIIVIRFTGSEIHKNPYKCAREAIEIMENYISKMYRLD
ncbi:DUF559 domain-containing protein [Oceanobacillus jeddahense]|uniref:DUF559 domain-containing protein n=1 Tax=Oceanobacillus jeddahense TaxID=1462527 RepID=UPI0005962BA1|nr:DUF559 domain-containing protein [Oceanobacillus jeddahense]